MLLKVVLESCPGGNKEFDDFLRLFIRVRLGKIRGSTGDTGEGSAQLDLSWGRHAR
jgi:hypothetical protein